MCSVKAYGSFVKRDGHTFRTNTYLQWGDSEEIIGACVMCNPGSASPQNNVINSSKDPAIIELELDQTLDRVKEIFEGANIGEEIEGKLLIYNLFTVQCTSMGGVPNIVNEFKTDDELLNWDFKDFKEKHKSIPWIWIAWGCEDKIKDKKFEWYNYINKLQMATLGIPGKKDPHFYHPLLKVYLMKEKYKNDMIEQYINLI